jgi:hypothetical protein
MMGAPRSIGDSMYRILGLIRHATGLRSAAFSSGSAFERCFDPRHKSGVDRDAGNLRVKTPSGERVSLSSHRPLGRRDACHSGRSNPPGQWTSLSRTETGPRGDSCINESVFGGLAISSRAPFNASGMTRRKILSPYMIESMTVLEPGPGAGFFIRILGARERRSCAASYRLPNRRRAIPWAVQSCRSRLRSRFVLQNYLECRRIAS